MARRTLSIASSPGWKARFSDPGEPEGFRIVTLLAWALVEDEDGSTEIVGVIQRRPDAESDARTALVDEIERFDGYVFTGLTTRPPDAG